MCKFKAEGKINFTYVTILECITELNRATSLKKALHFLRQAAPKWESENNILTSWGHGISRLVGSELHASHVLAHFVRAPNSSLRAFLRFKFREFDPKI